MKLKFTQQQVGLFAFRIFAAALIIGLSTQVSFSQKRVDLKKITPKRQAERIKEKSENYKAMNSPGKGVIDRSIISVGPAPVSQRTVSGSANKINVPNPNSRAFNYNGGGPFQLNSQSLLNTSLTPLGAPVDFGFPGAMALQTTTGKLYAIDQAAPFSLYYVDTVTGTRVFVVNCTGVPHANLTGITWDPSTSTMYGVSTDVSSSQIFTINLTTGVCTPIGSPSAVSPGAIQINAAPGGSLFGVDIVTDNLYRWNKSTGVPALVGSLGIDCNFGQDGHFDFSDGQYYWAAYNNSVGQPELRVIDTTNGSSTFIGAYIDQVSAFGIYSPAAATCSGTPNPGNTISSVTSACPTAPFALTLQNFTNGTGVTYQWQSGPSATGPWTNVGPNSHIYVTSQTSATWYRCIVTCSGNSGTSTVVGVPLNAPTSCYCAAGATSTLFEKISNVLFSTIDNASTSTAGYEDFTAINTTIYLGQTLPMTVEIDGGFSSDQVLVWIDFNHNGSFGDAGEQVWVSGQGVGPHTGNITIPGTAQTGTTRMRIRMHDASLGPNATPCGNSAYGQVEDYTVDIQPCIPIAITGSPSNASAVCGSGTSFTVTTTGSAPSYSWEYRVNPSSAWQLVPNSGIYSGANTATLTLSGVTAAYNGYQFRALVSGACAALDYSSTATLTITSIIPVVDPASATICRGTIQKLSLTNTVSVPATAMFSTTGLSMPLNAANQIISADVVVSGIPPGSVILNVAVGFDMDHTYVGDVGADIIAPNGHNLNLFWLLDGGSGGNSTANFTGTYFDAISMTPISGAPAPRNGTYTPDAYSVSGHPLFTTTTNDVNDLLTGNPNGTWKFAFYDSYPSLDDGLLKSLYVNITYSAPVFAQGTWTGPAGTMWNDAAATIPYTGTLATTIYVNPTVTSNYNVSFTTPAPCTSAVTTVPVNVVAPISNVVDPSNQSVCIGNDATFSVSASGGPITYQWQQSFDGGTTWTNVSGATGTTLSLADVTEAMDNNYYRVILKASPCTLADTTAAAILTVNALPVVSISASDLALAPTQSTTITATSTPAPLNATSWSWTLNGLFKSGNSNTQVADMDSLGFYQATVTDIHGCINTSNILELIAEPSDKLWIYPNPTTGAFQVRLFFDASDVNEKRIVTIYDIEGRQIMSREYDLRYTTAPYLRMDFDLSNMARGTYVVKVAHKYTGKVVGGLLLVQ